MAAINTLIIECEGGNSYEPTKNTLNHGFHSPPSILTTKKAMKSLQNTRKLSAKEAETDDYASRV